MKEKKQNRKNFRPLLIGLAVIFAGIFIFSIVDRGSANGNTYEVSDDSPVLVLTDSSFDETISDGVVLVDFWATWCPPCRIQGPIIEELAAEISHKAVITKLDVDDYSNIAARFGVRNIPTLLIFKDGEVVERFVGVQQKETLKLAINQHL